MGFEPTLPEEPDLKSGALDHSANVIYGDERHRSFYLPHAKQALYHLSYVPLFAKIYIYLARVIRTPDQRNSFLHLQSVALPTELSRVILYMNAHDGVRTRDFRLIRPAL